MKTWRMIGVAALWLVLVLGVLAYAQGDKPRGHDRPMSYGKSVPPAANTTGYDLAALRTVWRQIT